MKKKKRILIVDDDESILDALSLVLEEQGYQVDTIFKGDETYEKVDSYDPHLILLDVLMSGKDGRIICKRIKSDEKTKSIPVIMISAHPTAQLSIKDCMAHEFLPKPFETKELIRLIKKYI